MAINLNARLRALECKLNPVIGLPMLALDYLADEIDVCNITMYRLPHESRRSFCDRVQDYYDQQVGVGLVIVIHPSEQYDDDE